MKFYDKNIGFKSSDKVTIPFKYILGVLSNGNKGGLISEGFSLRLKPPSHSPHKEKMVRRMILHLFFRFDLKWKTLCHLYFLHKIKCRFVMLIAAQITINITWKHLGSFPSDLWAWEVALRHRLRREPLEHIKARTDLWPHEKPTGADDAMYYHSMHTLFDEKKHPLFFILDTFPIPELFYCDISNYTPTYFSM